MPKKSHKNLISPLYSLSMHNGSFDNVFRNQNSIVFKRKPILLWLLPLKCSKMFLFQVAKLAQRVDFITWNSNNKRTYYRIWSLSSRQSNGVKLCLLRYNSITFDCVIIKLAKKKENQMALQSLLCCQIKSDFKGLI